MPYKDIAIPDDMSPAGFSYMQRRAELLRFSIEAGHPDLLSRKRLVQRYDVHPSTITRDIQALREEIRTDIGTDADFISHTIYQRALRDCAERQA